MICGKLNFLSTLTGSQEDQEIHGEDQYYKRETWGQIDKIAQDRRKWKSFVDDLCPGMNERV